MTQKRLDTLLCERSLAASREKARAHILAGEVWLGERRLESPSLRMDPNVPVEIRTRQSRFVSRGGLKLEHALTTFSVSVEDRVCLDIGASTGGFTDCLLKAGAKHVFSVDVGYGQMDWQLRNDEKTSAIERVNARYLSLARLCEENDLAREIDLVVADVSFISLRLIVPALKACAERFESILLFKPQFEVGRKHVLKGGVVKDASVVKESLESFNEFMLTEGFKEKSNPLLSPVPGKKSGNVEYLVHYEFS